MSLWKFNDFEAEVDFADADFIETLEEAQAQLEKDVLAVPTVEKVSDILRAQVDCYAKFFDSLFGNGASNIIAEGRCSVTPYIEAANSLFEFYNSENVRYTNIGNKYIPRSGGNRQQRRYNERQNSRNYNRNHGRK